jgi:UDP-N-acetylglucosamine diphosphorylase/glucosamine-1-phosphate N-acetyltransferase
MNLILFDDHRHSSLKPITWTRPVADIRIGIITVKEKWEKQLATKASYLTLPYLQNKFSCKQNAQNLLVNGALLPNTQVIDSILSLKEGEVLLAGQSEIIALLISANTLESLIHNYKPENLISIIDKLDKKYYSETLDFLTTCPDIFAKNDSELEKDFELITKGRTSAQLHSTNTVLGNRIFVEEGAKVQCATINTNAGSVYIGKNTEIMEGSLIRGGFALCEGAVLKLGTKIYGATTIGPECRVGGEVNNSVLQGYSNKGHDGFLGNSVLGEWCNLGADTNTSNLKNNYGNVKVWNYPAESFVDSGRQFVGLCMGDHSKCGINTMFNTGTTVGVFANIFGSEFPPKFIPSFAWGNGPFDTYDLSKAIEVARSVMQRRSIALSIEEEEILQSIFNQSAVYRN